MDKMNMPLEGITVVELSTVVAAPTAARMLCAYGADVIKVEASWGDEQRVLGISRKVPCSDDMNPMFDIHNSNKKLISVNIKSEEGKSVLFSLLEKADVFITNIREKSLQKSGLDYDSIKDRFARLIYAQFYGFGPEGPVANNPGFDRTAFWSRSGPLADWCVEGEHPFYPSYAFGDMVTSSVLLSGILMALIARDRTGKGTKVNTSLYASGIWCSAPAVVQTQFEMKHINPEYDRDPVSPFVNFYPCKDGRWIALGTTNYSLELPIYSKVLGLQGITEDSRWSSPQILKSSGYITEAVAMVKSALSKKTSEEWRSALSGAGLCCEVLRRTCEVSQDEQAFVNGYVEKFTYSEGKQISLPCPPIFFSDYTRRQYQPCGKVGSDTNEVLGAMGYSPSDIDKLKEIGAIS